MNESEMLTVKLRGKRFSYSGRIEARLTINDSGNTINRESPGGSNRIIRSVTEGTERVNHYERDQRGQDNDLCSLRSVVYTLRCYLTSQKEKIIHSMVV